MRHPKCFTPAIISLGKGAQVHLYNMAKGDLPAVIQEICRRARGLGSQELLTQKSSFFSAVLGSNLQTYLEGKEPIWFLALYTNTDRSSEGKNFVYRGGGDQRRS